METNYLDTYAILAKERGELVIQMRDASADLYSRIARLSEDAEEAQGLVYRELDLVTDFTYHYKMAIDAVEELANLHVQLVTKGRA